MSPLRSTRSSASRPAATPARRSAAKSAPAAAGTRKKALPLGGGGTLMQRAASEIGSRIVRGVYPPGTALPFEEDIGRELGIGRNIVREAIKALVAKGMLVTLRRAGTKVQAKARWNLLDPEVLEWAVASEVDRGELIAELTQLRRIFEPEVAALAAANASRADALRLFEAYETMERYNQDPLRAIAADIQFHERLFEATHNQLIQSLVKSFVVLLRSIFELSIRSEGGFIRNLGEHLMVAEAVASGDAEGARAAMRLLLGKNEADLVAAKALPPPSPPRR